MSTTEGGGRLITNGLVAYYDAANLKSYLGTGITWSDMIGTNNLTLLSGNTFSGTNSGTMVYNGISARTSSTTFLNTGQDFTVSVWMKASAIGNTRRGLIGNGYPYSGGTRRGWYMAAGSGSFANGFFISIGQDTASIASPANILSVNTWYYLTATVISGGSNILLYKDDSLVINPITNFNSGLILYDYNEFNIGWRKVNQALPDMTDPFTGNIALVQIYNRVLSAQEISINYNLNKIRFGK